MNFENPYVTLLRKKCACESNICHKNFNRIFKELFPTHFVGNIYLIDKVLSKNLNLELTLLKNTYTPQSTLNIKLRHKKQKQNITTFN